MHRSKPALLLLVSVILLSSFTFAQTSGSDADRLIQESLKPSPLESDLHHLTDEIGGRIPGTPAMLHAVQWGVQAFKAAGADIKHFLTKPYTAQLLLNTLWSILHES